MIIDRNYSNDLDFSWLVDVDTYIISSYIQVRLLPFRDTKYMETKRIYYYYL